MADCRLDGSASLQRWCLITILKWGSSAMPYLLRLILFVTLSLAHAHVAGAQWEFVRVDDGTKPSTENQKE